MLKVRKLTDSPYAMLQTTDEDAGYDLFIQEDVTLYPGVPARLGHGIAIEMLPGYKSVIMARSSTLFRHTEVVDTTEIYTSIENVPSPLVIPDGLIDPNYRDELKTAVLNLGEHPIVLTAGSRISQLVLSLCVKPVMQDVTELSTSDRTGGFGTSGQ